MRAVRSKNTKPEILVRSLAHQLGYRFRLHRKDLPGRPDMVFPKRKAVIFVHGCFWHGHDCEKGMRRPSVNQAFWNAKLDANKVRDIAAVAALQEQGWSVLIIWECETKDSHGLAARLREFLG